MTFPLLNLGKKVFLSNFNLLQVPYKLTFAITYLCNLKCKTCNIWQRKSKNELRLDEIEKIFENNKFSWINLTGGEPYLRRDLTDLIRIIVRQNRNLYFLNFTSNGFLTDRILSETEKMLSFIKIPKFAVGVSIEGHPEIDGVIRGDPESFKRALQTLKGLREVFKNTRYQPFVSYTISPENLGQLQATLKAICAEIPDFKLTEFHVNLFHFSSHYYGNVGYELDSNFASKAAQEIRNYLAIYNVPLSPDTWLERKYLKLLINFLETQKTPLPCQALRASCYFDSWGNVYACAMYDKRLGALRETGYRLLDIWKSEVSQETRKIISNCKCPNCWTPCEAYQTILGKFI